MPRPGMFDMLGRAKWCVGVAGAVRCTTGLMARGGDRDAWEKQKRLSSVEAMVRGCRVGT